MLSVDVNCLLGHWPFRKLYKSTFEDMKSIHKAKGIAYGYVSSLNSIFYNDPYEGDEELHDIVKDTPYRHVLTVNPSLPCFREDIEKGLKNFDIAAVRIYPGYHGYSMQCPELKQLCTALKEYHLPLFLTLRLEDERLGYLLQPGTVNLQEIRAFVEAEADLKVLLLNIRFGEILLLKETLCRMPNVLIDTSGLKDQLFNVEKLTNQIGDDKLLYGSQYPLNCLSSTLLEVTGAEIETQSKEKILFLNSRRL